MYFINCTCRYLVKKVGVKDEKKCEVVKEIFGAKGLLHQNNVEDFDEMSYKLSEKYLNELPEFTKYFDDTTVTLKYFDDTTVTLKD